MMKRKKLVAVLAVLMMMALFFTGCEEKEAQITIFAAASLQDAMTEITDLYKLENPKVTVMIQADSSGTLQTQIEEGAECDIFFSAAMKQMKALDEGGYILPDSIKEVLNNEVVLIKPTGTQTAVTGFENIALAASIALAGEDVPVGAYAREIFTNMGILEDVMGMEINECANVSAVLAAISEGSNEVGVVYATDAALMPDSVEIISMASPEYLEAPVVYPIGLVKNEAADQTQQAAAKKFYEFLQSEKALTILEHYGFSIIQ